MMHNTCRKACARGCERHYFPPSEPLVSQKIVCINAASRILRIAERLEAHGFYRRSADLLLEQGFKRKARELAERLEAHGSTEAMFAVARIRQETGRRDIAARNAETLCSGNSRGSYYFGALLMFNYDRNRALETAAKLEDTHIGCRIYEALRIYHMAKDQRGVERCLHSLGYTDPFFHRYALALTGRYKHTADTEVEPVLSSISNGPNGLFNSFLESKDIKEHIEARIRVVIMLNDHFYEVVDLDVFDYLLVEIETLRNGIIDDDRKLVERMKGIIRAGDMFRAKAFYLHTFMTDLSEFSVKQRADWVFECADAAAVIDNADAQSFAFSLYQDIFEIANDGGSLDRKTTERILSGLSACARRIYELSGYKTAKEVCAFIAIRLLNSGELELAASIAKQSMKDFPLLSMQIYYALEDYGAFAESASRVLDQISDRDDVRDISSLLTGKLGNHQITRDALRKLSGIV